ncbi:MAG: LicD family protein [Lachnospiraceae bacterium]|nr:LicD family protein [Lachnospiraceae bacterium]
MDFSVDFFRDEVRNGFYIPTVIKQAWAASLMVLSEIDRICTKYEITYFADWGTILGAVRHGGFVPWDDDLDICMKREDYRKFRAVADQELPAEFAIHDYERKEDHWLFLARVVNRNQICFEEAHLKKYHNFPYMAGIDIFIQDYLYPEEEHERKRCDEIKRLLAVADGIVENTFQMETIERALAQISQAYKVKMHSGMSPRSLGIAIYQIVEKLMAQVPEELAYKVGQIFPWGLKGNKGLPKEYYEKIIRLPFENTTIPVPACYHKVLESRYGDYLQIRKVWNGHDYPYFEGQRKNLQAVADFQLPEFTFSPEMLKRMPKVADGDSLKGITIECMEQLHRMTEGLMQQLMASEFESVLAQLPECQQLAVDFATLVEEVKGTQQESCELVVSSVQGYCDALYGVFLLLTGDPEDEQQSLAFGEEEDFGQEIMLRGETLQHAMQEMEDVAHARIIEREEVLFLPIGPKEWKGFASLYAELRQDADVYVVPLPLLYKDYLGRVTAADGEMEAAVRAEAYPKDVSVTAWTQYDLKLHSPKTIYIQNPYDGENPCLTVPPQYYAKNLQPFTDQLIYVPPFTVDEFGKEDYNDLYNMKHYVTAPAVIYADRVLVQSENMKQQYVEKLVDFAGEDTRAHWDSKICSKPVAGCNDTELTEREKSDTGDTKKHILYCIGLNELSECKETVIESIRERFEIFQENQDSIVVTVCLYPEYSDEWDPIDPKGKVLQVLLEYENEDWCKRRELSIEGLEDLAAAQDAYYGSSSPLVPLFVHEKKPVMIADYEVKNA